LEIRDGFSEAIAWAVCGIIEWVGLRLDTSLLEATNINNGLFTFTVARIKLSKH
jgi:hypothetical protein